MASIDMKNIFEMIKVISGYSRREAERRYEVCRDRYTDDNHTSAQNFDFILEASMLSQRLMDLAKEEVKSEELSDEPNMNTDAWIQVPKGDDMKYWLNKYGRRRWTINEERVRSAERAYYWCDRVLILDENHRVLDDIKFSDFILTVPNGWVAEMPEPGKENVIYREDGQPFYLQSNGLYQAQDEHGIETLDYDDRRKDI